MPRPCSICRNENREDIDRALVGGMSIRDVAARWKLAASSVSRHRVNHLGPRLANSIARTEDLHHDRLTAWATGILDQALLGFAATRQQGDHANARGYLGEARRALELVARMTGDLDPGTVVNVDARRQTAVLAQLSEGELRALLAHAEASLSAAGTPTLSVVDHEPAVLPSA